MTFHAESRLSSLTTAFIYLGQKGGGAELNRLLKEYFLQNKDGSSIFINSNANEQKQSDAEDSILFMYTPKKIINLPLYLVSLLRVFLYILRKTQSIDSVVLIMASPWDFPILKLFKVLQKKIYFVVHDLDPHPGEKWPRKKSIVKRIHLSDNLIFLSCTTLNKYISRNIDNLNKNLTVIPLPVFKKDNTLNSKKFFIDKSNYLLFIGRFSKYKGLEILNSALLQLDYKDLDIIIAGEGKLEFSFSSDFCIINRWLNNDEISSLIENARVIIFPYIEASQSGFLPICMNMGKEIIISDQAGLVEQTLGYKNLSIFKSGNSEELISEVFSGKPKEMASHSNEFGNVLTEQEFAHRLNVFVNKHR
jgi:glycosyltransferase involved in cell wall biosynthesis